MPADEYVCIMLSLLNKLSNLPLNNNVRYLYPTIPLLAGHPYLGLHPTIDSVKAIAVIIKMIASNFFMMVGVCYVIG